MHMGSVSGGTVSFLCVYMWGEGVNIRCVHEGGNICLCICVLCRLRLCVRSGLDSAHSSS